MDRKNVKLGEICKLINGDRGKNYPSQKDIVQDGDIPFINAGHLIDNEVKLDDMNYISLDKFNKLSSGKVNKGDILYCLRGSLGKKAVVKNIDNGAIASSLVIIRPDLNHVSTDYLSYILDSSHIKNQLSKATNGSTQPNLSAKSVSEYNIKLHGIEEQKEITVKLNMVKKIIDSRKIQVNYLDDLVKSKFFEMFGNPVSNNLGWNVVKLNEVSTKICSGTTPKGGRQVYVDEGIMFFRSQNVWKNRIELDDIAFINEATHKKMMKSSLKHKDILMTKTGRINTENSSLGRAAMYTGEDGKANINGHVYLIRIKDEIVKEFILFILISNEYRNYIRRVCVGGIDKRQLNKHHIENFPIIQPPTEMQSQFVKIWKSIEWLKEVVIKSLDGYRELYDSLMQEYFM